MRVCVTFSAALERFGVAKVRTSHLISIWRQSAWRAETECGKHKMLVCPSVCLCFLFIFFVCEGDGRF